MASLTNADAATATEATQSILIPSLPNHVAVHGLARVPRRYHPVLAAVSKPIRSLISSTEFFDARSCHNCTEILPYLMIQNGDCQVEVWFPIRRRPNPNSNTGDLIVARIPGAVPDNDLDCSKCAAVGPKIYILCSRTHLWIFDCRFHTWEGSPSIPPALLDLRLDPFIDLDCSKCAAVGPKIYILSSRTQLWIFDCHVNTWERGPPLPTALSVNTKTVVLGTKIYMIQWPTGMTCWADVFDTVVGQWEAREELRVNHQAWEVVESGIRSRVHWFYPISEVNGLSCSYDSLTGQLKCLDEITGVWKEIKCANNRLRFHWEEVQMSNVGGSLAVSGWRVSRNNGRTMVIYYLEIEVKKDQDGDFWGEILLWSEKVHSTGLARKYTCIPVSM